MVTDFGLARMEGDSGLSFGEGRIVGTPYYMSPEQIDGRDVDGRTDIYALGATFYYLVTGVRPFVADTPVEILLKHVNEDLVPPLKRAPDLPQGVSKIIEKMLVKDRDKRYQSLRDVLKDLEAVQKGQEVKVEVVAETKGPAVEEKSIFEGAAAGSVAGSELARSPAVALATERPRSFYYLLGGLGVSTLLSLALGAGPIREILVSAAELTPREIEAERRFKALDQAGERSKAAVERWKALAADMGQSRVGVEAQQRAEALAAELAKAADDHVRSALDEAQKARAAGRYAAAIELLRAVPAEMRESPLAKSIDPEIAATLDELARRRGQAYVPAGPFIFCENEMQKKIELPAYYVDLHEVSNRDWAAYVQGGGRAPARWMDGQPPPGTEDLPVTGISVRDAFEYARAKGRGKRVPNIYEWEKAARGPEGRRFPWGDELDHGRANQRETGPGKLEAVTSRPTGASAFGCLHMAGNAAEWAILPQGPDAKAEPEAWVKGGAYGDDLISCRAAFWLEVDRETKATGHEAIGLRLVQDVEP
jgi:formylglycine-generating enzyme required for sulfatase activity